jgi:outer membrane protein assembly factor BamB/pimeloyl-ACP methyl ester carboxylesterase
MKTKRAIVGAIVGSILGILLIASAILFVAYQLGIFVPPFDIFGGMKTPESPPTRAQLQLIWHTPFPRQSQVSGNPVASPNGVVYQLVGTQLLGFDQKSGQLEYQRDLSPYGQLDPDSLSVDNDKISITSLDGFVHLFDASADQTPQLSELPLPVATVNSGIAYSVGGSGDDVYKVTAYDVVTGKNLWRTDCACIGTQKPVIFNTMLYVLARSNTGSGSVLLAMTKSGDLLWSQNLDDANGQNTYRQLIITDNVIGLLYTTPSDLGLITSVSAYDKPFGQKIWELKDSNHEPDFLTSDGNSIYASFRSPQGFGVEAINATNGTVTWQQTLTDVSHTGLPEITVQNGTVYVVYYNQGQHVFVLDEKTGDQLGSDPSSLEVSSPPVVHNGMLFLRRYDSSTSTEEMYGYKVVLPPPPHKLFVLAYGLLSKSTDTDFRQIVKALKKAYTDADFMNYSYRGIDKRGNPLPYTCEETFTHHISELVTRLKTQIINYLELHPNTQVYVIGHSMGGVIAYGLLADMMIYGYLNFNGGRVLGVATMSSPLGGIPGFHGIYYSLVSHTYQRQCKVLASKHLVLNSLADLVDLFPDGNTSVPFGGKDSLMRAVSGGDSTNQLVAQAAVRHYIDVLTIGNVRDYTFNFNVCPGYDRTPDSRFLSTQWVTDQGNDSRLYARVITEGKPNCPDMGQVGINHAAVFLSTAVQTALIEWSQGKTPTSLPVAPIGP